MHKAKASADIQKSLNESYAFTSFNSATSEKEVYRYPHNIVLELLSMTGLVGIALFALSAFVAIQIMIRAVLYDAGAIYFFGYAVFVLITAMVAGDFHDYRMFWCMPILAFALMRGKLPRVTGSPIADIEDIRNNA